MGKIKNILFEYFDLYGRQNLITFKHKQEYKSLFGVFATIFYLILFLIFIIYYLILVFSRKHFTITTTIENNPNEIVSLKNDIFYFGLIDKDNNYLNFSEYLDIEFIYYYSMNNLNQINEEYNEINFYSSNCENNNLNFIQSLNSMICLNLSNSNISIDFQGNFGTNNYSYFDIKIIRKKSFSKPIEFFLAYFINEIDYSNYKNPLKSIIKIKTFFLYNDYYLNYKLPINKVVFESDDRLFYFKSIRKYEFFDFDNMFLKSSILANDETILNLSIENSNNIRIIKRNYLKFDEVLAKWQSLCDILFVVIGEIFGYLIEKVFISDKINLLFFFVNKKNEGLKNSQIKLSKISQNNLFASKINNNPININNLNNNIIIKNSSFKKNNNNKNRHKTNFKLEIQNYIFPLFFFKKNENVKVFLNLSELMDEIFSLENFHNLVNKNNNINLNQSNNINNIENSSFLILSNNNGEKKL